MVDGAKMGPVQAVHNRSQLTADVPTRAAQTAPNTRVAAPSLPTLLKLVADLAKQEPPIDAAKIAEIRQAIATGSYEIRPQAIADAMVNYFGGTEK